MLASATLALMLTQSQPAAAFDPGPAVGASLPAFEAPDQDGRVRRFDDLKGPNGLVLVFFRSADW